MLANGKNIFTNGYIVLPHGVFRGSLVIEKGKVSGLLSPGLTLPGYEEVDVNGRTLMPGLIDPHVHMWDPSPLNYREDWLHGSQCAASGGITTIVDMPLSVPPVTNTDSFRLKYELAKEKSCVDFAFWGGLTPNCLENLEELNGLGCVAYKGFMSYANPDYPQITDGYLIQAMETITSFDGLVGLHAENAEIADLRSKELEKADCPDEAMHDDARSWWVELEAIQRAVFLAEVHNTGVYICHMTIPEGGAYLKQKKAEGVNVSVETCPHYLVFDKTILRERKAYAKCNPPFRSRERVEELWEYVFDGTIDTIGSDHGPYSDWEKTRDLTFWQAPCGFGGFDALLPCLLTEGVHKRGLSLPRLSELTSFNAARLLGLSNKGSLLPGADADVVVVDLDERWTYDGLRSLSKTKSEHNVYHGMGFIGRVKECYVRGEKVFDGRKGVAAPGFGQFVPRTAKKPV